MKKETDGCIVIRTEKGMDARQATIGDMAQQRDG
jgi:hypothetical protein